MSAFSTLIYIIDWEWISSGAGLPMDAAQGIGIGYMFVALCAQLPGLFVGSFLGYWLSVLLEEKKVELRNVWVLLGGAVFFVVLVVYVVTGVVVTA
jgi:hypothetical protein